MVAGGLFAWVCLSDQVTQVTQVTQDFHSSARWLLDWGQFE